MKMRRAALIALLILASGCTASGPVPIKGLPKPEAELTALMLRRLELAREVAWAKWNTGQPVNDPAREEAVLATVTKLAVEKSLPPEKVRTFFAAQIAASKRQQNEVISTWIEEEAHPDQVPADLLREIRPKLDRLSCDLVKALAALPAGGGSDRRARVQAALEARGCSSEVARLASAPLAAW